MSAIETELPSICDGLKEMEKNILQVLLHNKSEYLDSYSISLRVGEGYHTPQIWVTSKTERLIEMGLIKKLGDAYKATSKLC